MRILLDKRAMFEKYTSAFSATVFKSWWRRRKDPGGRIEQENSMKVAQVLIQELDIGGGDYRSRKSCWRLPAPATTTICRQPISPALPCARLKRRSGADGNEVPAPLFHSSAVCNSAVGWSFPCGRKSALWAPLLHEAKTACSAPSTARWRGRPASLSAQTRWAVRTAEGAADAVRN